MDVLGASDTMRPMIFRTLCTISVTACLAMATACGDDEPSSAGRALDGGGPDASKPADGGDASVRPDAVVPGQGVPGQGVPGPLFTALEAVRASDASLCAVTDRCYPERLEDEPEYCHLVSSSFQRGYPFAVTDPCWVPIYERSPQGLLTMLRCTSEAHATMQTCLKSCPDDDGAERCYDDSRELENACQRTLVDAIGRALLEDLDVCEKTLMPDEDDGL
jgi:hypothetical protein